MNRGMMKIICFILGHKIEMGRYWHAGFGDEIVTETCLRCNKYKEN